MRYPIGFKDPIDQRGPIPRIGLITSTPSPQSQSLADFDSLTSAGSDQQGHPLRDSKPVNGVTPDT
jgi:hypothetical protein